MSPDGFLNSLKAARRSLELQEKKNIRGAIFTVQDNEFLKKQRQQYKTCTIHPPTSSSETESKTFHSASISFCPFYDREMGLFEAQGSQSII